MARYHSTALAVILSWILAPSSSHAQPLSPYSRFQTMTLDELNTVQAKLTYLGPQRDTLPTVAFTTPAAALNLSLFTPFRRPGFSYVNDQFAIASFTATAAEMKAMIDQVALLPNVTAGGVASRPYLSFALLNTRPSTAAFEAILDGPDIADLFGKLRVAFQANRLGSRLLGKMACTLGAIESQTAADFTAGTSVTVAPFVLNPATRRWVSSASIRNNLAQPIPGPLSLVVNLRGNVYVFDADGFTCAARPAGIAFVNVAIPAGGLAPAGVAQTPLEIDNQFQEPVIITTKVLAGPGSR